MCICNFDDLVLLGVIIVLLILNYVYIIVMFVVIRGDYSSVDFYLCVFFLKIEIVVFSIDGFFIVSMFIFGKDFKVRSGVVDVVRLVC